MRLIAVDKTGSSLCSIDPESLRVLHRLPMPFASHDFVISPGGDRAFISIYGDGVYGDNPHPGHEIVVVDLERFERVGSIDISPYTSPHGLAFDRSGILWAACDAHSCAIGILPATGSVAHVVDTSSRGTHWIVASGLTGLLYTSNKGERFLSAIDPERAEVKANIAVPHGAEGICFGPGGRSLYVTDRERAGVLEIDAATNAIRRTIEIAGLPETLGRADGRANHHMRVCVSADGSMLAVAAYHFDRLVLVDLADTSRQVVMETGKGPTAMAFHPDRPECLYFSNHDGGTIGVIDTVQGNVTQTVACDAGIEVMRFL